MSVKTETYAQYRKRLLAFKKTMQGKKPARKNPTKAQKRPNKLQRMIASTKRAKQNRVAAALKKFLHQANPAIETSGAMITKLKGGGFTIRPIKAVKRGRR
jgi:hypothetical protein